MKQKISGVVVLYNPKEEVITNIGTYIKKLEKLYVVDNSETSKKLIIKEILKNYSNIEYINLKGNMGIAKALNIGIENFLNSDSDFILTMDQDSYFSEDNLEKLLKKIESEKESKDSIFSPRHKISDTRFIIKKDKFVKKVITSGNILTKELIKKVGKFNEDFFIDEVDHEYCFRARQKGCRIKVYGGIYLNHSLGERDKNNRLPKFLVPTHHNAIRRYYITRNKFFMIGKYPELKIRYILTFFNDLVKVLLYEKDKLNKIKMMKKGYKDYKNNVKGKYKEQ